jgi:hypothetical protein
MYRLIPDTLHVVSFYKDKDGRLLTPFRHEGFLGYHLWAGGSRTFFSTEKLRAIVERNKLKRMREEMYSKTSISGVVKTGDYIVGSINKQTGAFSTSSAPARHLSLASAKQEAARLAGIDKSKRYVVMKMEAIASVEEVVWQ